jgi:heat shock protein HtpX
MGHIRNRDTLIMTVAATWLEPLPCSPTWRSGAIFGFGRRDEEDSGGGGMLSLLFMAILAPIAATLIQLAISRSREYFADSTGAAIAGAPSGLARALEKLHYASQRLPMDANPATAHLFIVTRSRGFPDESFSTHPPIEERIVACAACNRWRPLLMAKRERRSTGRRRCRGGEIGKDVLSPSCQR